MSNRKPSLAEILEINILVDVIDIGANPDWDEAPYKTLLGAGLARVIGFEPNQDALDRLNSIKGANETYFPNAIYDGNAHELKVCEHPGMTSLLEPNTELLSYFHALSNACKVKERRKIPTVRLDDVKEIENIDILKIDIQGGELEVFRNGVNRLRDCLVVHTEVGFLPMYERQPLFSDIEIFLRNLGFTFHRFAPLVSRTLQPMIFDGDEFKDFSQAIWADAIFIKDFTRFDQLSSGKLKSLALIVHEIYSAFDIVLRALMAHDVKFNSNLAEQYKEIFSYARAENLFNQTQKTKQNLSENKKEKQAELEKVARLKALRLTKGATSI